MNEAVTKRFLLYFRLMLLVWILIVNAILHVVGFEYSWLIFLSNIMLFTMEGDIKDRFVSVELGGLVGMVFTVIALLAITFLTPVLGSFFGFLIPLAVVLFVLIILHPYAPNVLNNVGFAYQQPLLRTLPLYLETGLYLTGRGGSVNASNFDLGFDEELSGKVKFNMLYLQVPVVVSWHFNVRSVSIQPLAGVFYGFGIHGKAKFKGEKADLFKSTDLGDGAEEEAMFKRSDLGLRFGANVTFRKHYNVSLGYDLGLLNILKDADEVKAKNGSFFVSLGYNF